MQVLNPMSMTIRYSLYRRMILMRIPLLSLKLDNGLGNEYTLRQWMCPDPRCAECTRK